MPHRVITRIYPKLEDRPVFELERKIKGVWVFVFGTQDRIYMNAFIHKAHAQIVQKECLTITEPA